MQDFFATYGGLITAVLSGILTIATSVAAWLINRLVTRIDVLEAAFESHQKSTHAVVTELKVVGRNAEHISENLKKTEGRIDEQQKTIIALIEKMATITAQLGAVFRVLDAPRRATDGG